MPQRRSTGCLLNRYGSWNTLWKPSKSLFVSPCLAFSELSFSSGLFPSSSPLPQYNSRIIRAGTVCTEGQWHWALYMQSVAQSSQTTQCRVDPAHLMHQMSPAKSQCLPFLCLHPSPTYFLDLPLPNLPHFQPPSLPFLFSFLSYMSYIKISVWPSN